MKKFFAILMTIVLLMGAACAETPVQTRTRMLELDGETLEITETAYTAENYSFWYQADILEAGTYYGHPCLRPLGALEEDMSVSYLIVPSEIAPDQAEAMLLEATGGYEPEWTISMEREFTTDAGIRVLSVDANNGFEIHRYYLVVGEAFSLCITAMYPGEISEEMSALFDIMTQTFEF